MASRALASTPRRRQVALLSTALLFGASLALVSSAFRIFKKFELQVRLVDGRGRRARFSLLCRHPSTPPERRRASSFVLTTF